MPTAMITGAGGGLGSALAHALAPTHTLFLAGRPSTRLDEVATRFGATTWPIDLTDVDSIPAVVEPIVELDVLIHTADFCIPSSHLSLNSPTFQQSWRGVRRSRRGRSGSRDVHTALLRTTESTVIR